ncbi:hypothetical protein [Flavilitoribacter nigricans]|uniref:Tetratricopeptide repeat protein n=1 Tax=Flavilitoribacter nigricans (strain ATCC 23147 / DSM 23189 / NBRC 102662 / NCIMB 1420 / SS-2) TaxID=1122177 RepID=A0A2D0MXI2_FLAN2|nr:hypothetical protein [Flavilitoribacter nigricans]PHN00981.1 hypothetical protein CRP01_39565 [Flavilitoribacter nigricans DSM 23189 = NBRC 102662]
MASLENLKDLAKGISRNKVKNIHVIGNHGSETVFDKFYQFLIEDQYATDEEYANYFYPDTTNYHAFYKLKDRLFNRLINTVFFIDINKKGLVPVQKAFYECYKNAAAVKILLGKGIRVPAIGLAEKTLKKCLLFGFTDLVIELARHIRMQYASFDPQEKDFNFYTSIIDKHLKIYKKEIETEEYLYSLLLKHENRTNLNQYYAKVLKTQKNRIKKILLKGVSSMRINLYCYFFLFTYYELSGNWKKLIKICDEVIQKEVSNPNVFTPTLLGNSYYRKIKSLFILEKYALAESMISKCLSHFKMRSHDWFSVQDIHIKICLHNRKYTEASKILEKINEFKKDNYYYKTWQENVKVYDAFLHYLQCIGRLAPSLLENENPPSFRLQKFLNEVPNHSKDKKGSNVTILILQILFLLEQRKYDDIIDRTESLRVYVQRYLKEDGTYRSNCFIKMLLCLPAGNFERPEVAAKAQEYLDRLHAMPIRKAKQSAELEVMPYEMLWEFVLESLDRKATSN